MGLTAHRVMLVLLPFVLLTASPAAPAAEPIPLRAGQLTMVFDADNAFLRYVHAGPHEVLRGINAPVRNKEWGTVLPEVSNLRVDNQGDHFEVAFDATCREGEVDFRWRGRITGSRDGEVEYTFDGLADSTFLRNRIGFCVLHSSSAAGRPWLIRHVDGQESEGQFPEWISPHQPAKEIQAVSHEVAPELWAHVEFEGDVFEMEDQRNWTDASFKTYCTPLERPYPVEVKQGEKITQKIRFRLEGEAPEPLSDGGPMVLTIGENATPLPPIGLQVSSETNELSDRQIERLRALQLDHLRVDLHASDESVAAKLDRARRQAAALGVKLHVGVHLGEQAEAELDALASSLNDAKADISQLLILNADRETYDLARKHLAAIAGDALFGLGNDTNFVDLNRNRPTTEQFEVAAFAINPQIHAVDSASMVETLPIQGDAVRTARHFLGDHRLAIGPITLRPQHDRSEPPPGELPPGVDIRQPTPFAAAWTLGSIKFLAAAGVESANYFETVGWKGVMDLDQEKARPGGFPAMPGQVYPVYYVLREVGEFAGGSAEQLDSANDLAVVGLSLKKAGKRRILIANLTDQRQTVSIAGLSLPWRVQLLGGADPAAANAAGSEGAAHRVVRQPPLDLPPYAIARLDRAEEDL